MQNGIISITCLDDVERYAVLNEAQTELQINVQYKEDALNPLQFRILTQYLRSRRQWSDIVPEELAELLVQQGFKAPSRIQSPAIIFLKATANAFAIVQSQNGTGKTLAFLLPTLLRIDKNEPIGVVKNGFQPQAIVLTHVKDLCTQTYLLAKKFELAFPDIIINVGDPKTLTKSHLLICTPGNLLTLTSKRMIDVSKVKVFVVDEADFILTSDVGNKAIVAITKAMTNKEKQFLFFSATCAPKSIEAMKLIKNVDQDLLELLLPPEKPPLEGKLQLYTQVENKIEYIETLILNLEVETQMVIFANSRSHAQKLFEFLVQKEHKPALFMGNLQQEERDIILTKFKKGEIQILITTNVLATGVDNRGVGFVINLDMPLVFGSKTDEVDVDMYLNRIGKSRRFTDFEVALNLLSRPEEKAYIEKLEAHYNTKIEELKDLKQLNKLLAETEEKNKLLAEATE